MIEVEIGNQAESGLMQVAACLVLGRMVQNLVFVARNYLPCDEEDQQRLEISDQHKSSSISYCRTVPSAGATHGLHHPSRHIVRFLTCLHTSCYRIPWSALKYIPS